MAVFLSFDTPKGIASYNFLHLPTPPWSPGVLELQAEYQDFKGLLALLNIFSNHAEIGKSEPEWRRWLFLHRFRHFDFCSSHLKKCVICRSVLDQDTGSEPGFSPASQIQ